ncbi:MAG: hypothetical protein AUI10_02510 [Actinobacteria bacterium 13_2_20CM_2_72_6]|nr:MAG: hypothetical protein AUI10_02510 [Actinobacteria bacterium 13_2_20CM_2_72_6]
MPAGASSDTASLGQGSRANRLAGRSRAVTSRPIGSRANRRATNRSASALGSSSHCASSTRHTSPALPAT